MIIQFKDIDGFGGLYFISNTGVVSRRDSFLPHNKGGLRKWKGSEIKPRLRKGYLSVTLYLNGKSKQFNIHRLIALAFIPNPNNYPQINHINGIKTDNRIENLEWCTNKYNMAHARNTGLLISPKGDDHYSTRLSQDDVKNIRDSFKSGDTQANIAAKYNLCQSAISRIITRKNWKHI